MTKDLIACLNYKGEILFAEHHQSHAASAFLVSPFDEAAIYGRWCREWATVSLAPLRTCIRMPEHTTIPSLVGAAL